MGRPSRASDRPVCRVEVKGNYCPLADTIRSFDELCEGKWDHLPDQAFMCVGAIEEAAERAEKMEAA